MAARGGPRGRGLGLRIGVPPRTASGSLAGRPVPPLAVPQPLPLPPVPANEGGQIDGSLLAAGDASREQIGLEDLEKFNPPLGQGSGGKVYKVRHRRTGQFYALKIIYEKHGEEVRKQILREMEILRNARCPQIVQCLGIYDRMGEISFVLELMDGGTLADIVKLRGGIPEEYLAEITRQVLQGLSYLHRLHVVHRDIKPSNLLVNHSGEVKIADFGVSTTLDNTLAQCNSYVGTSAYLSPERINPPPAGGRYNAYAGDVWSLGLTLLELKMGRFPYLQPGQTADWMTLFGNIVYNDPPVAPEACSLAFRSFISSCLQKDPMRRPSVRQLIEHPFAQMYQEPRFTDLRCLLPGLDPMSQSNSEVPGVRTQILQFAVAMFVLDTWQYFMHRYMHQNQFLYRHLHSWHHRLVVPYAAGALYNHPMEGLLMDTIGGALSFLLSGMHPRTAVFFFCFATMKTVDDHCGLVLPLNPFQALFRNNSAYHDIHHQLHGLKYNFSQPFFSVWDTLLGTHMPYTLTKRVEGGFEARPNELLKKGGLASSRLPDKGAAAAGVAATATNGFAAAGKQEGGENGHKTI